MSCTSSLTKKTPERVNRQCEDKTFLAARQREALHRHKLAGTAAVRRRAKGLSLTHRVKIPTDREQGGEVRGGYGEPGPRSWQADWQDRSGLPLKIPTEALGATRLLGVLLGLAVAGGAHGAHGPPPRSEPGPAPSGAWG